VHIYGSYRKIKTGVPFFGTPCMWSRIQIHQRHGQTETARCPSVIDGHRAVKIKLQCIDITVRILLRFAKYFLELKKS